MTIGLRGGPLTFNIKSSLRVDKKMENEALSYRPAGCRAEGRGQRAEVVLVKQTWRLVKCISALRSENYQNTNQHSESCKSQECNGWQNLYYLIEPNLLWVQI